jgi:hypothetical protein
MPLALMLFGTLFIVVGIRGTYPDAMKLIKEDFTGQGNFFVWLAACGIVGSIGFVPQLQQFSRIFLGMVLLVFLIKNVDFPNRFIQTLNAASDQLGQAAGTGKVDASGAAGAAGGGSK